MPSTSPSSGIGISSDDILNRLSSTEFDIKLKAMREVKNKIIGNPTKKLSYIKLGVVPHVATILAESDVNSVSGFNLIVQSAAALGSFAQDVDSGVQAVLDAGAFPNLVSLLSSSDEKVSDEAARSLRIIYQSKVAPKLNFLEERNMKFILSLLNSDKDNFTWLSSSVIKHSCQTNAEQKALCDAGALQKLIRLLEGSVHQRNYSLESLATLIKNNPEVVSKFVDIGSGRALSSVIELLRDSKPQTRLLACICLICVRNTSSCYLQDIGIKRKLVNILLELLDDVEVGDEASFAFSTLLKENEEMQKLAFEADAVKKLSIHLHKVDLQAKRHEGILLTVADLCSKLESCRYQFLSLKVLDNVIDALSHDNVNIRTAACICLRNVSRSVKISSAGCFMSEKVIVPLIQLLSDSIVQISALGAVSNIVLNFFSPKKLLFTQFGGIRELVRLAKSMDPNVRSNALWALRNFVFLADRRCKRELLKELTVISLHSLIEDPEASVQEQGLALVRNLVDGYIECIDDVFAGDGILLDAIRRQLQNAQNAEIGLQGLYVLSNVATGNESHKEMVMKQLIPEADDDAKSFLIKFMQSEDTRLRTAAVWIVVNLTFPASPGEAFSRFVRLRTCGVFSQIASMHADPCLDVKLRVTTALGQVKGFEVTST